MTQEEKWLFNLNCYGTDAPECVQTILENEHAAFDPEFRRRLEKARELKEPVKAYSG